MPFEQPFPRSFSVQSVRSYAPASPGVYGISNARAWLYIGETDNLQEALINHLGDTRSMLMASLPTGFVIEPCAGSSRIARQDRLVKEYGPVLNQRGRA
jgi:hypothetical protein